MNLLLVLSLTCGTFIFPPDFAPLSIRAPRVSRVGDSISVSPHFLSPLTNPKLELGEFDDTARAFRPSFARASYAAANGWSAWTVLEPAYSAPECRYRLSRMVKRGRSPVFVKLSALECEFYFYRPNVALIMFGTNDVASSNPTDFENNLWLIIEKAWAYNVTPVLSTIPERPLGGDVTPFNAVIRRVADESGSVLWDYYADTIELPGQGIGDGVHPSLPPDGRTDIFDAEHLQYGYTVRNLGALCILRELTTP